MANPGALRLLYEGPSGPGSGKDGPAKDGAVINQVFLPERQRPEFGDTAYLRNGKRLAAALLGVPEDQVTPGGQMLIYKPPTGGRAAPWYQDEAFWDDRNHLECNSLSVWMSLDDAVVESGCMQFLPGSHRNDVLQHRKQPGDPLTVDEPIDTSTAVPCPLPAGGATFHHCRTLHHTAPNTSGRPAGDHDDLSRTRHRSPDAAREALVAVALWRSVTARLSGCTCRASGRRSAAA